MLLSLLMYLKHTADQSHHTNGKQQMEINVSVFFRVSLWLIIRVHMRLFISLDLVIAHINSVMSRSNTTPAILTMGFFLERFYESDVLPLQFWLKAQS